MILGTLIHQHGTGTHQEHRTKATRRMTGDARWMIYEGWWLGVRRTMGDARCTSCVGRCTPHLGRRPSYVMRRSLFNGRRTIIRLATATAGLCEPYNGKRRRRGSSGTAVRRTRARAGPCEPYEEERRGRGRTGTAVRWKKARAGQREPYGEERRRWGRTAGEGEGGTVRARPYDGKGGGTGEHRMERIRRTSGAVRRRHIQHNGGLHSGGRWATARVRATGPSSEPSVG